MKFVFNAIRVRDLSSGLFVLLALALGGGAAAAELDEFKVKREALFEFDEKPAVARKDQKEFTISFASKGWCDATVAVEGVNGKIVRHLASGVLGPKAPEPFQKDSKKQTLIWDGKDDQGNYPPEDSELVVRVSLGLKPRFERTLFWDPRKRSSSGWGSANAPIMKAAPEGVYVYDTGAIDHLRLFNHDGNYLRTVYPFPADKVSRVNGLQTHTFPHDGKTLPWKSGFHQATLLFGKNAAATPGRRESGFGATSLAVSGSRIALAGTYVSHFATDGTSGGLNLAGPKVVTTAVMHGSNASVGHDSTVRPCSAALSPDGKWLYLTGYMWRYTWHNDTLHGVVRVAMDQDAAAPEPFAGSMKQDDAGTGDGQFRCAVSVACDAQGRVYVADHMNDRLQVFSPEGKFLKSIAVFRPAMVQVHPKTGEIYVFSWGINNRFTLQLAEARQKASQPPLVIEPKLIKLGTFDAPKESASLALPLPKFGNYSEWYNLPPIQTVGEVDFNTEPPTIWISQATDNTFKGEWDKLGIQVLREKGGKLEVLRDFGQDVVQSVARATPPMLDRQRLYVNPKTEKLYVAEADSGVGKAFKELLEIDPETGAIKRLPIPFSAEDVAFDLQGLIYLRSDDTVTRYDPGTWREVPWDYGEERDNVAFEGGSPPIISTLVTPGHRSPSFWHMGGMYINVKGHLVLTCPNPGESAGLVPLEEGKTFKAGTSKPYMPRVYPGRMRWGEIHVWDKYGKLLIEDAVPGLGHINGIGIDAKDNVYVMANGSRLIDGKPYDPSAPDDLSETLIKVPPSTAKVLSATNGISAPLGAAGQPKRGPDFAGFPTGNSWVEGAEWMYAGVGYTGNAGWDGGGCRCWNARFCLDYFARSFAPETRHFSVAVLDASGNLILRIGQYGNVDDGVPLDPKGGSPSARSIGGDEVSLFHAAYVGALTDRRLFIADAGNARILSVKLGYTCEEKIPLKGVREAK